MNAVVQVCIPKTKHDYYDYLALEHAPKLGARVRVSFRRGVLIGVVVGFSATSLFQSKLKPILEVLDPTPLLTADLLAFYEWIARYYHASLSDVLHLALPKRYRQGERRLLHPPSSPTLLPPAGEGSSAVVLHKEQQLAVDTILNALGKYQTFLLQGVTGSGKTEVYLQLIERVLAEGKQVLVLVPEIGLTPQLVSRFQVRLTKPMVVIHSHLNDTERNQAWMNAASGQAALVLGTRSALFTPMPRLGLIVIDEEHDASFKQQDGVKYSARDCALIRASKQHIPVILGSATPSLETYHNAVSGKYKRLILSHKAMVSSPLHYELVDLRRQPMVEGLAETTYLRIEKHLHQGQQVLVFINRRGFAPVCLCHACGWIADCPACERHYTVHQKTKRLMCHHCGRQESLKPVCGSCKCSDLIWLGVGTQRLYKALVKRFPTVSAAQIDRDELKKKHALEHALDDIASGKTQLMVGTQLLAKGHHFPALTLVVMVDADAGFYNQDFRALERLGQLLLQVAGRAGREQHQGEVLIQTHLPHHPMLNLLIREGYDAFVQALLCQRREAALPPYVHMGIIFAKGRFVEKVDAFLQDMKQHLIHADLKIYGPAPAAQPKKAGSYRMQLCLMAGRRQDLHEVLLRLKAVPMKGVGVKWSVDVDPVEVG